MSDFLIQTLRGGLNEDPPTAIADDQCTVARNVEFWVSMLGERRLGSIQIALAGTPLAGCTRIVWLHRHLPTTNPADAQLWVMGITDPSTVVLAYKDTTWHVVATPDAPTVNGVSEYLVQGQTLHGKLFIAYDSAIDRLHVWDNGAVTLRRAGLTAPVPAPTAVGVGVGTLTGARFYRDRLTRQVAGKTVGRSEPSPAVTFTPVNVLSITVTRSTPLPGEMETHWELEASVDNANFYRISVLPIATTTYSDTTIYAAGYAQTGVLSDEAGAYSLIPSVRYLTVEQDRLMAGGSFEDAAQNSSVLWTPVFNDPTGVSNDERVPIATSNALSLDNYEGGPLTGLSATVNGYVYATKWGHVYQLTRSGQRAHAYEAIPLTKQRGAIHGSLIEGLDQSGNPTPFLIDPDIGPCRIGVRGVEPCGADIRVTFDGINLDATKAIARGCYFNEKKQIHWWIATGVAQTPNLRLVLHTQEMRQAPDGMRRGWAVWDGGSARALAVCLFADNIDTNGPRSNVLTPFIGLEGDGLIQRTDVGVNDNGAAYSAEVRTKPFTHGSLLNQFECLSGAVLARAAVGGVLTVTLTGDFGRVQKVVTVRLDPVGAEPRVVKPLDDLGLAELRTLQVRFADPVVAGAQWSLEACALREEEGAGA